MIVNPEIIPQKYECGREIMEYLAFDCQMPILGYSSITKLWYFANNDRLRECLKNMPLKVKIKAFIKNMLTGNK